MIVLKSGSIFGKNPANTLVCPVDLSGRMDTGLAAEFKEHYPNCYEQYVTIVHDKALKPGEPWITFDIGEKNVLLLPIAVSARSAPKYEWIESGLKLAHKSVNVCKSFAFPLIGGQRLDKFNVIELIQKYFGGEGETHWLYIEEC